MIPAPIAAIEPIIACEPFSSVSCAAGSVGLHGCGYLARGLESTGVSYRIPIQQGNVLTQEQVNQMVQGIQHRGYYPYITDPDEVAEISSTPGRSDELFLQEVVKTLKN